MRNRPAHAAALGLAFALATASPAMARPLISLGGGLVTSNTFVHQTHSPLAMVAARAVLHQRLSVFLRAGHEAYATSEPGAVCLGPGCPTAAEYTSRARYVPLAGGLRLSSSDLASARPFLDLASSLSWARFEDESRAWYPDGRRVTYKEASRHWLTGVEIGVGVQHRLGDRLGLEWEARYGHLSAPRQQSDGRSLVVQRDGITRVAFVLALTL